MMHSIWYVIRPEEKHFNSESLTIAEPLRVFITGRAGVGKSYLVKISTKFLTNTFNLYSVTSGKQKVFLLGLAV